MKDFTGQRAWIFGGSSGIGLAAARHLASRGAHVLLLARDPERLADAVRRVSDHRADAGQRVAGARVDVADPAAVKEVCAAHLDLFGPPDLLLNSAGRAVPRRFEDIPLEQFEETLRVNLHGPWYTCRALVPAMKARGRGVIVNTASIAGFVGVYGYTDYAASKFGVLGFSEALRAELKPHGVRVSVLCPPDTDTPGFHEENRTKPEETRAISASGGLMTADQVAKALFQGLRRDRPIIVPGFDGALTWRVKRWWPALVEWTMDRRIARVRRSR